MFGTNGQLFITASSAIGGGGSGGSGFPFSGSAVITGSLLVSGSGLTVTGSTNLRGTTNIVGDTNITGSLTATGVILTDTAISDYTKNYRILKPKGGVRIWEPGDPSPRTGAIRISYGIISTPHTVKVRIKDMDKNSFIVTFGGNYDYDTSTWTDSFAYIEGDANQDLNFNIRFGSIGDGPTVYIGELSTTWGAFSPDIYVEEVSVANYYSNAIADLTWIVTFESSTFTFVTSTISNTNAHNFARSGSNAYYNLGNVGIGTATPITTLDISGSGRFTNNLTVTGSLTVSSGSTVELQVLNTGVRIGSISSDIHTVTGSLRITGSQSLTGSLGILGSVSASSFTGSLLGTASTASFASTASSADNFTVRGTLTAQTIVAQTITSSTDFVTGSTRFGSLLANTHQFTGSVSITGSLNVAGNGITGSLLGTASWAQNAVTASYALTASLATNVVGAANRILFNNATNTTTGSNNLTFDGSTLNVIGAITTTGSNAKITAGTVGGDEGGELLLGKPETNTTLTGSGVTIDIFQNRLRFFEQGGTARGYFIDITGGGAGVSTNLVGGGSGTPGGSNTQIQYNNAGAFGGVSTLTFDGTTLRATGSFTGSFTGSLLGTASFATTASFALNAGGGGGASAKAGSGSAASFGGTPRTASITFGSAFSDNLYAVTVTGEDARSFTIQSKSSTGFTINSNSSVALTGPVYWIATAFN
jgi:hypothetical protein